MTPMNPIYVFEGYTIDEPWVIVLALAHNYERLKEVPSDETNGIGVIDIGDQYARGTRASYALANWIREQGYYAKPYPGSGTTALLHIPPAIDARLRRTRQTRLAHQPPIRLRAAPRCRHYRDAARRHRPRPLRRRRILQNLPGLHPRLPAIGDR